MISARRNQPPRPDAATHRRNRTLARGLMAGLGALALAGCSTIEEYTPDVGFTVLEPSKKQPAEVAPLLKNAVMRPVAEVTSLELGTLRRGRLLTAHGSAAAPGWFQAELKPRGQGPSRDGFLEFDFIAAPPELNGGAALPEGSPVEQAVRADRVISESDLASAVGLRVYAANGVAAVRLAPKAAPGKPAG